MTDHDQLAKILRDNITFSGQVGDYVIHGAIEKIIEWADNRKVEPPVYCKLCDEWVLP